MTQWIESIENCINCWWLLWDHEVRVELPRNEDAMNLRLSLLMFRCSQWTRSSREYSLVFYNVHADVQCHVTPSQNCVCRLNHGVGIVMMCPPRIACTNASSSVLHAQLLCKESQSAVASGQYPLFGLGSRRFSLLFARMTTVFLWLGSTDGQWIIPEGLTQSTFLLSLNVLRGLIIGRGFLLVSDSALIRAHTTKGNTTP